jgi:hypothetical protein
LFVLVMTLMLLVISGDPVATLKVCILVNVAVVVACTSRVSLATDGQVRRIRRWAHTVCSRTLATYTPVMTVPITTGTTGMQYVAKRISRLWFLDYGGVVVHNLG